MKQWSGIIAVLAWGVFALTLFFGGTFISAVDGPDFSPEGPHTGFALVANIQGLAKWLGIISVAVFGYISIMKRPSQHIEVSGIVGVMNFGPVLGNITATVTAMANQGGQEKVVASAIEKLADAITKSGLTDNKKKEALDVVNDIATQANAPPEKRSSVGSLKAMLKGFPDMIKTAEAAKTLWDTYSPVIQSYLGLS